MINVEEGVAHRSTVGDKDREQCQSIEWYAEGQVREVDVGGIRVTVRFVGRRGRRGRISIVATSVAVYRNEK